MMMSCMKTAVSFLSVSVCVHACVQYGDGKKRRKPNYSSVDLSEVEWEDKDDMVSVSLQNVSTLTVLGALISILCWLAAKCHGEQEDWDLLHGGEEER